MTQPDNEQLLRAVLDGVPCNIVVLDSSGTIVLANKAWSAFAAANGVNPSQVGIGTPYLAVCDGAMGPDAGAARNAAAGIRDVLDGRAEASRLEYPCHSPHEHRWFLALVCPLRTAGFSGAVVLHTDITERQRAVETLRASEERYRLLVEHASELFYRVQADETSSAGTGRLQFVSKSAEKITGHSVDEFINTPGLWLSLVHPDDLAIVAKANQHCMERLIPAFRTYRLRRADGQYRWIDDRVEPIVDAGGRVIGRQGVARDITDQRLAAERLRESERSLALAQATAHLGDWTVRADRTLVWSDEMFRLHHLEPKSADQAPVSPPRPGEQEFANLVHPDDREGVVAARRALSVGGHSHLTFLYRTNPANGPVRTLETQARAVTDDAGRTVGWHGTVLDVTERERQSAELRQHQKMQSVGRLAGGIAHDFNNILSEIIGFATFVRDALEDEDPRRADIGCVLEAADRAAALTRQLLAYSRQRPSHRHPVDLNQQIEQFSPLLKRTVGEHIALSIEPGARPAVVLVDPGQFDQVVLNLVSNARDAMPDGGTLRISINLDAANAYLRVTDTGAGMDADTQQRIFDPFFTTKPVGHGTGLGLATCFGIVEDAGGTIRVESAVGAGSTFLVTLPLSSGDVGEEPPPQTAVHERVRGAEVLLCEDEAGLRRMGVRALEEAGYRVHAVADGDEAIHLIDTLGDRLAVVVSDVVMPGCSGDTVAAHAARVIPNVPVVLTSGYFDHTGGMATRALEILWKPLPPARLVAAVTAAIAKSAG